MLGLFSVQYEPIFGDLPRIDYEIGGCYFDNITFTDKSFLQPDRP